MLGRRHKKHRYVGKTPDLRSIIDFVAQSCDKIKWKAFFAGNDRRLPALNFRRRRVARFSGVVAPEVSALCYQLQSSIFSAVRSAVSSQRGKRKSWSNVLPIERAAHAWLWHSDYAAVPTDKDGGFCLVLLSDLIAVQQDLLSGPWYSLFGTNCIQQTFRALVPRYRYLVSEVVKIDDRVSAGLLLSSLNRGHNCILSPLIHTIKTHKPPGEVAFRPVHSSGAHSFMGLMAWCSLVLKDGLRKYKHLLFSSQDLINKLEHIEVGTNDVFLHFDLKDFFMTGSARWLVYHSAFVVAPKFREVYRKVATFILENQYIGAHLIPHSVYKVVVGSGMGLKCSSELADAAFVHAVELCGLGLLTRAAADRFAIKSYFRFRDNLLFIGRPEWEKLRSLKQNVIDNIQPYVGTLEEVSAVGVTFLDLNLVKDERWRISRRVSFNPYLKPTSLLQVLSVRSNHLSHTHAAWMKAYMLRIFRCSSSLVWYRSVKRACLERMSKAGVDRTILREVDRASNYTFKSSLSLSVRHPRSSEAFFWVKLPHHPVWTSSITRSLRRLSEIHGVQEIWRDIDPNVAGFRASWCLNSGSLSSIVRKY